MKKNIIVVSIFIVIAFRTEAQEPERPQSITHKEISYEAIDLTQKSPKPKRPKHGILFAPVNLFDIINPNFQLGYEYYFHKKWAFQAEGAIMIYHSIPNLIVDLAKEVKDCPFTNNGFKLRGEIKHYIDDIGDDPNLFFGLEFFYLKNKSGVQNDFVISDSTYQYSFGLALGQNGYHEFFYNHKEKYGINLIIGKSFSALEHFFYEVHGGIGLAVRNSFHTDRENLNDKLLYHGSLIEADTPGKSVLLSLPFNVKIGYRF